MDSSEYYSKPLESILFYGLVGIPILTVLMAWIFYWKQKILAKRAKITTFVLPRQWRESRGDLDRQHHSASDETDNFDENDKPIYALALHYPKVPYNYNYYYKDGENPAGNQVILAIDENPPSYSEALVMMQQKKMEKPSNHKFVCIEIHKAPQKSEKGSENTKKS